MSLFYSWPSWKSASQNALYIILTFKDINAQLTVDNECLFDNCCQWSLNFSKIGAVFDFINNYF